LILGAAAATTIGATVFYFLGGIGGKQEDSKNWLDWLIIGLLVFLAVRVYVERKETKPPKWMGWLEKATVGFAASIGFPLYLPADGSDQHADRRGLRCAPG
jgi:uncharacterized membrane protein YfcA